MKVITRIPPSPTGRFHIGTARTALFNYLFARHHNGQFIFRSEDTDQTRSKKEYEDEILEGLKWLGLEFNSFSRQSEHIARYRELLEKLVAEEKAYISKEPSREKPGEMTEVIRLKNPGTKITFHDEVRGDVTFDTTELHDFVIAKSLDEPLYHFAVVVDDWDAGVTHVIRGEDHVSNTPRQILIQEALGALRPVYAHLPLIVDEHRAKLSKRAGATSVMNYRDEGFLSEALINYLALLGWNPGTPQEYFSLAELVDAFSLEHVQKSSAAWDREKLLSMNQHWMRKLPDEKFLACLDVVRPTSDVGRTTSHNSEVLQKAIPLLKERAKTFQEAREMLSGELSCLFNEPILGPSQLLIKEPKEHPNMTKSALESLLEPLKALSSDVSAEEVRATIMPLADAEEAKGKGGRGAMLWPLRYALSGKERSPDPFTIVNIIGPEEAAARVQKAIAILGE